MNPLFLDQLWHEQWCMPVTPEAEAGAGQSVSLTAPESGIWTKTSTTALETPCHSTIITFQLLCSQEDE